MGRTKTYYTRDILKLELAMFEILKSEYRGREEFFTEQPKKESDTSSFT